ncbi:MAG: RdgB/HAM1 family non-canonical purine NTP pyrophosphatase [Deltaproteobacteria bacterium]|nr:RdgB/HAM1 family non-canonical purine NTP pyrophosphatase [Deltaproteobacteria bacterium]
MQLVLASRNAHKIEELRRIAPEIDWVAMPEVLGDPPETADSFDDNARQKARFVASALGGWALADDSGLEVDALGGRPGVWSKRYSPEGTDGANNALLLRELSGVATRTARYRCVIALVGPSGEHVASGACEGVIGDAPRGSGGFGYDPLFLPEATPGRTMAELSPGEKDAVSHRGAAMAQLPRLLAAAGLRA